MQRLGNPYRTNLQRPGKHAQPKQESDRGQNTGVGQAEVDTQSVSYSRTIMTGQWACLTTESDTLPISARLTPPSPLLPITIRSAPSSSAKATISRGTAPILR